MNSEDATSTPLEQAADEKEAPTAETGVVQVENGTTADDALQNEMAKLQEEVNRLHELYLRKLADFDNYRKRMERGVVEARRFANAELLRDCLPVVDNLERALAAPSGDGSGLRMGVELVLRQFREVLVRHGMIEVDPMGSEFDPSLHEAVYRHEAAGVEANTVVQVLQKGYLLGERLLRPALVEVAVPPARPGAAAVVDGSAASAAAPTGDQPQAEAKAEGKK